MKRYLLLLFAFVIICSSVYAQQAAPKKVGVLWYKKSGMAMRVYEGFAEEMKRIAPNVEIELKAHIPTAEEADPIYKEWQETKDAICFFRSDGAKYAFASPSKVPVFIGAANNPEALGIMPDMKKPNGNITGVTYAIDIKVQLKVFKQFLPKAQSVGLLVMEGHPSAPIEQKATEKVCKEFGWQYHTASVKDKEALKAAVIELRDKVDFLIIGNQNLLIDNGDVVLENAGTTPVMSYTQKPIQKKQAIAGLTADDHKLGIMLAQSVVDVIIKGKAIKDVPVKTDQSPKLYICLPLLKKFGLRPPLKLMKLAEKIH